MVWHPAVWHDMLFIVRARNPILFVWTIHSLNTVRFAYLEKRPSGAVEMNYSYIMFRFDNSQWKYNLRFKNWDICSYLVNITWKCVFRKKSLQFTRSNDGNVYALWLCKPMWFESCQSGLFSMWTWLERHCMLNSAQTCWMCSAVRQSGPCWNVELHENLNCFRQK